MLDTFIIFCILLLLSIQSFIIIQLKYILDFLNNKLEKDKQKHLNNKEFIFGQHFLFYSLIIFIVGIYIAITQIKQL